MFRNNANLANSDCPSNTAERSVLYQRIAKHAGGLAAKNGIRSTIWSIGYILGTNAHLQVGDMLLPKAVVATYGGVTAIDLVIMGGALVAANRNRSKQIQIQSDLAGAQPEQIMVTDGSLHDFEERLVVYQAEVLGISPDAFAD